MPLRANPHCSHAALVRLAQIFDMIDAKSRQDCIKEIDLLKSLNHPNVIRYLASFIDNNEVGCERRSPRLLLFSLSSNPTHTHTPLRSVLPSRPASFPVLP